MPCTGKRILSLLPIEGPHRPGAIQGLRYSAIEIENYVFRLFVV